jgi:hypothetical protein
MWILGAFHSRRICDANHITYIYEIAEKYPQQHFEWNTTMKCSHNPMSIAHKLSDRHHLHHELQ